MEGYQRLIDTVIKGDYCVGCGVCAFVENSPFQMKMDSRGQYIPTLVDHAKGLESFNTSIDLLEVCPFGEKSLNENQLATDLYADYKDSKSTQHLGYHLKNFAGYVHEGDFRERGSSGGMGSWILKELLCTKEIDTVIHVKENQGENVLFSYGTSNSVSEILEGSKSKYYPIEMSKVLEFISSNEGKYVIIGVPCFIKAVRLLMKKNEILRERIKFCISLVCGHLKSEFFAQSIGWQAGIHPNELENINFRLKLDSRNANDYAMEVTGENHMNGDKSSKVLLKKDTFTANWGHGFFKYNACEYCDDVLGETADLTIGDAWLPQYVDDSKGTNLLIVRNPIILSILETAVLEKRLYLEEIDEEDVIRSQYSGIRHRTEGLSYRLEVKDKKNEWRPQKRTQASNEISSKRRAVYDARTSIMIDSLKTFKKAKTNDDYSLFVHGMEPTLLKYQKANAKSKIRFMLSILKRKLTR